MGLDDKIRQQLLGHDLPRSIEEADNLLTYFSHLTFFSKLMDSFGSEHKEFVISSIWRTIRYTRFMMNQVVFREGDVSNGQMFVIISGEASVAIKKKINVFEEENKRQEMQEKLKAAADEENAAKSNNNNNNQTQKTNEDEEEDDDEDDDDENEQGLQNKESKNDLSSKKNNKVKVKISTSKKATKITNDSISPSAKAMKERKQVEIEKFKQTQSKFIDPSSLGDVIARLGSGFSFGEKAIMEEGGIRMASIFASSDMEALVIMREDFLSIKKMIETAKKEKIAMLKRTIPGLEAVNSWQILEQLAYVFIDQKFLKNDYLSHQGKKTNMIYLLVQGTLAISSEVEMEIEAPTDKDHLKLSKLISGSPASQELAKGSKGKRTINSTETQGSTQKETIELKICDIDTPQFVCEDVLAFRSQQYNVKVISSKALCYAISKRSFQMKFPRESVEMTKQLFLSKQKRRQEVIYMQIQKYQSSFKSEDHQESLKADKKQFKQKFKKQYLRRIYDQSLLSKHQANQNTEIQQTATLNNINKNTGSTSLIQNQETNNHKKNPAQRKLLYQTSFLQGSQSNFDPYGGHEMDSSPLILQKNGILSQDSSNTPAYSRVLNKMKNDFSDYLLENIKGKGDQIIADSFQARFLLQHHSPSSQFKNASNNNKAFSSPKNSNSPKRFSLNSEPKSPSNFSALASLFQIPSDSLKSPLSPPNYKEEASPKSRKTLQKFLKANSRLSFSSNDSSPQKNIKTNKQIFDFGENTQQMDTDQNSKGDLNFTEKIDQINTSNENQAESDCDNSCNDNSDKNYEDDEEEVLSHKKGASLMSYKLMPIKASLFRNEKSHDNQHMFSEEEIKKVELSDELIDQQSNRKNQSTSTTQRKRRRETPQEKSLLLEGTWNMGKSDFKKMEFDLKLQLQNRGLYNYRNEGKNDAINKGFQQSGNLQIIKIQNRVKRLQQKQVQLPVNFKISSQTSQLQNTNGLYSNNEMNNNNNNNNNNSSNDNLTLPDTQHGTFSLPSLKLNTLKSLQQIKASYPLSQTNSNKIQNSPLSGLTPSSKSSLSLPLSNQGYDYCLTDNNSCNSNGFQSQERMILKGFGVIDSPKYASEQKYNKSAQMSPRVMITKSPSSKQLNNQQLLQGQFRQSHDQVQKWMSCDFNKNNNNGFNIVQKQQQEDRSSSMIEGALIQVDSIKSKQLKIDSLREPSYFTNQSSACGQLTPNSSINQSPQFSKQKNKIMLASLDEITPKPPLSQASAILQRISTQRPGIFHQVLSGSDRPVIMK